MEHKYISKKEKWVSNGNGGQELIRRYRYDTTDNTVLGLILLFALVASPFLLVRKIRRKMKYSTNKPLIERLKEKQEENLEKLYQARQRLWNVIKDKRNGEDDIHFARRLKRYGFTTDGAHVKTGVNYQINEEKEIPKMSIDIKSKLKQLEGETFYTVKGLPFTYRFVTENAIKTDRTDYNISISSFYKAIELNPKKPGEISRKIRGSSYVFGIISDNRFD